MTKNHIKNAIFDQKTANFATKWTVLTSFFDASFCVNSRKRYCVRRFEDSLMVEFFANTCNVERFFRFFRIHTKTKRPQERIV